MNTKIVLDEKDMPKQYLNINYYLKRYLGKLPDPPLHPGTKKPITGKDLEALFPRELIRQEVSLEKRIEVPEEVYDLYRMYRPSPLIRAKRLEKFLGVRSHIYYKYEGVSMVGSHKINTAVPQAFYNKKEGVKNLVTETGAGQWGSALSLACRFFGLTCTVYMVRVSYDHKPYRRVVMELYGANVIASPSTTTVFGRKLLKENPNHTGSLGIAIGEALETVIRRGDAKYALGSVLNHVLLHQSIIGLETVKQMEKAGEDPDILIGCCGGGSNFGGFIAPFLADQLSGKRKKIRMIGVEPDACPSMTKGEYRYDHGDSAKLTPLLKMETMGHDFVPSPIHAGGLRYHGIAPILAFLHQEKLIEARSYKQDDVFDAGIIFARNEGIIPAPESSHAIKAAMDEAITAEKEGIKKTIVFNLSGHGLLDMAGYQEYI